MQSRGLMLCGLLAPIVYVVAVVIGGVLRPDYSHSSQAVSDLIASGAPHKVLLDPLFALYNLLTIAFGIGLAQRLRALSPPRAMALGAAGALLLVAEGIFGLLTLLSPEDAAVPGSLITPTGTMHIMFAGLSSITTMLAMLLLGFWFRKTPHLRGFGRYSLLTMGGVFLAGRLAAFGIASHSSVGGLMERITIGGFLVIRHRVDRRQV